MGISVLVVQEEFSLLLVFNLIKKIFHLKTYPNFFNNLKIPYVITIVSIFINSINSTNESSTSLDNFHQFPQNSSFKSEDQNNNLPKNQEMPTFVKNTFPHTFIPEKNSIRVYAIFQS